MENLHPPAGHTARILDGKALAARIRAALKTRVEEGVRAGRPRPGLATLLVGDDPASRVYVRNKLRACETAGLASFHRLLPGNASGEEVLAQVRAWNEDPGVHGILVQLPLPAGIDSQAVLESIRPAKDVDGFHPVNQGRLLQGLPGLRPCTPKGILRLLDEAPVPLEGRHAVVVGRSNIVGKPVALMLLERHATVTLCHSRTPDLAAEVGRADVVVAAAGRAGLVRGAWIRPGAAVIDVGVNRTPDGRLTGDVEYSAACKRAGVLTPVPGGVGPMTIAMLLENTLEAAWRDPG